VLITVAREPDARIRDISLTVGITERSVQRILAQLEEAKYLEREHEHGRTHYVVDLELQLRHPLERRSRVRELLPMVEVIPPGQTE
jgi:DNA-binding IclR family transcriptional regulator